MPWAVVLGGRRGGRAVVLVALHRRAAIAAALARARARDVVLVAGKGHERVQVVAGRELEFDTEPRSSRKSDAALPPRHGVGRRLQLHGGLVDVDADATVQMR